MQVVAHLRLGQAPFAGDVTARSTGEEVRDGDFEGVGGQGAVGSEQVFGQRVRQPSPESSGGSTDGSRGLVQDGPHGAQRDVVAVDEFEQGLLPGWQSAGAFEDAIGRRVEWSGDERERAVEGAVELVESVRFDGEQGSTPVKHARMIGKC